ncbi:MAG: hypothetical protein IMZ53_11030 [Thermoplasmata archaeon]|nr:hypothetical protein [Thermoplasmata archaeon]
MTYIEAVQKARELALKYRWAQIVFYTKSHWWGRKNYNFTGDRDFVNHPHTGATLVAIMQPDGRLH